MSNLIPTEFDIKHANEMEIDTRERARRSHDTIRVFNPLSNTFSFMHDRFWHKVPAKSFRDMDRYLAMHFFKKICDFMIGQQIQTKGEELKKLREQQMGHQFLDHYEENVQVWDHTPKINDPDLINEIKKTVIIGLVKEYGMDMPEVQEMPVPETPTDFRDVHEQSFDTIDKIEEDNYTNPLEPIKNEEIAPLYVSEKDKKKLAKEITANE